MTDDDKDDDKGQLSIDFSAAEAARDAGIKQAVDHADQVIESWSTDALAVFIAHARQNETFTMEDVRDNAGSLADPPSLRAWGGVAVAAKHRGIVVHHDWTTARDPRVHCNVVRIWRSQIFERNNP